MLIFVESNEKIRNMKRNFYLQHPLMAMHDPRMQNLLAKETLKGTGAYWFIIENWSYCPSRVLRWNTCALSVRSIRFLLLISRKSFSDTSFSTLKRMAILCLRNWIRYMNGRNKRYVNGRKTMLRLAWIALETLKKRFKKRSKTSGNHRKKSEKWLKMVKKCLGMKGENNAFYLISRWNTIALVQMNMLQIKRI